MFKKVVLSEEALKFGRFLIGKSIKDDTKRERYLKVNLNEAKLRHLAY